MEIQQNSMVGMQRQQKKKLQCDKYPGLEDKNQESSEYCSDLPSDTHVMEQGSGGG